MSIIKLLLCLLFSSALFGQMKYGKVISVSDGDTVTVLDTNNTQTIIRLAEIDCPEKSQPYGNKAKKFTTDRIYNKQVAYNIINRDKYGRSIAHIYYDNEKKSLSRELVAAGMAWHYKEYSNSKELASLEIKARRSKKGLWSLQEPVKPAKWRKKGFKSNDASIRIYMPKKKARLKKTYRKTIIIKP